MSATEAEVQKVPTRDEVAVSDQWDLASLYPSDEAWEQDFAKFEKEIDGYAAFRDKLSESAAKLREFLEFDLFL